MKKVFFLAFALLSLGFHVSTMAQINPSPSQYFGNRLFQNVSSTTNEKGLRFDGAYRNVTPNTFLGSPVNMLFSLQGGVNDRSGIGLQFQNERAGLMNRSRLIGSYALDLSQGTTRVRLGIGMGMLMARINTGSSSLFRGDANDPAIATFNENNTKIDGSIGLTIENKGWEFLIGAPSLGSVQQFRSYNAIDYIVANAMLAKKVEISKDERGDVSMQVIIGYRVMQGVEDVADLGAQLNYKNWLKFMTVLHSNREMAVGVGIPYKNTFELNFTYNTGRVYTKNYLNVGGTLEAHVVFRFNELGKEKPDSESK